MGVLISDTVMGRFTFGFELIGGGGFKEEGKGWDGMMV